MIGEELYKGTVRFMSLSNHFPGADIEKGLRAIEPTQNGAAISSPAPSPSSTSAAPALVLSNSGKRIDQAGKKKYVKQVTGRHNDTELHLAAQRGDLAAVRRILNDIDSQIIGTLSDADFDAEVAEVRAAVVNEVNELGETAIFTAADKGYLDVVKELLKYSNKECLMKKNRSGFDALHIAASQGYHGMFVVIPHSFVVIPYSEFLITYFVKLKINIIALICHYFFFHISMLYYQFSLQPSCKYF